MKMKASVTLIILQTLIIINLTVILSSAAEYYVSPDGSATWEQCSIRQTPCHPHTALENVSAGDTVYFLDGQYNVTKNHSSSDYKSPWWWVRSSGSAGNPITFRPLQLHGANLHVVADAIRIPIIGSYGFDYIVWDGFELTAVNGSGSVIMAGVNIYDANHCAIKNSIIRGGSHNTGGAINYEGVRVENSNYTLVEGNHIYNFVETSTNKNTSGFKSYNAHNLTIKNNYFSGNSSSNIYIKQHGHTNILIENNFLGTSYRSMEIEPSGISSSISNITIRNNLMNSSYRNIGISYGAGGLLNDMTINNNTLVGIGGINWSPNTDGDGPEIFNNIIWVSHYPLSSRSSGVAGSSIPDAIDHNLLRFSSPILVNMYGPDETTYSTIFAWQTSGALYGGGNPGVGSITDNPLFVNMSGTFSEINDFRLAANSPARGAGRNGTDMGANVDNVGPVYMRNITVILPPLLKIQ